MGDLATEPQTLIHGDYRLDNMFFGAGGEDDLALVDWQVSGIGCGLFDVAYFLSGSVTTEVRREIERDALYEYADIVRSCGVSDFTFDECWRMYRKLMLGSLLVAVFLCGGLDLSNDRSRQLAETGLLRTQEAIEDLGAAEFMPGGRGLFTPANAFSTFSRIAYKVYKALR